MTDDLEILRARARRAVNNAPTPAPIGRAARRRHRSIARDVAVRIGLAIIVAGVIIAVLSLFLGPPV